MVWGVNLVMVKLATRSDARANSPHHSSVRFSIETGRFGLVH